MFNQFLQALPPPTFKRLQPALQPVAFRRGAVIGHIGAPINHLYFLDNGLISLVKVMMDGRTAEVGVVGAEGIVGIHALMGMEEVETLESMVQLDGAGFRIAAETLRQEMIRNAPFELLAKRYLQFSIHRLAQTAACNTLHRLRQRCCRWLLVAHDNAHSRTLGLTHEFLSIMMGVHRPRISEVLEAFQRQGLLETSRGSITILNRPALVAHACECYAAIHRELDVVYAAQEPHGSSG